MARVAPASWSFWAMPHAMERLFASPKTTAVLPAKLIMLLRTLQISNSKGETAESPPAFRIPERFSFADAKRGSSAEPDLPAKIDQLNMPDRAPEEPRAQALEFLNRVSGKAPHFSFVRD